MAGVGNLYHHFLEAVDQAAISSAAWRGLGEKDKADEAAVEAMRRTFDTVPFDGRVAIGEGERDEAPMLYIGEEIGNMVGVAGGFVIQRYPPCSADLLGHSRDAFFHPYRLHSPDNHRWVLAPWSTIPPLLSALDTLHLWGFHLALLSLQPPRIAKGLAVPLMHPHEIARLIQPIDWQDQKEEHQLPHRAEKSHA